MAQLAIKNVSKLAPFAGGPWNLPYKFHLYLINFHYIIQLQSHYNLNKYRTYKAIHLITQKLSKTVRIQTLQNTGLIHNLDPSIIYI